MHYFIFGVATQIFLCFLFSHLEDALLLGGILVVCLSVYYVKKVLLLKFLFIFAKLKLSLSNSLSAETKKAENKGFACENCSHPNREQSTPSNIIISETDNVPSWLQAEIALNDRP